MADCILALDFGGTKLSAAVLPVSELAAGQPAWLAHERLFSPKDGNAQFDIETMIALGKRLLAGKRPLAVGVSFGGPVDYQSGIVRLSHHVPGWENVPLQKLLAAEFSAPVRVDNDANVAALGEWRFGAGSGFDSLFYVTVSTGVGGGWVLNGRCWRGHEGMAGEIGHTVVEPDGPLCLCGKQGCVERLASGPYMAHDFMALSGDLDAGITGKEVAELAARGDEVAQTVLLRGARALGVGLGNTANLINPQRFILGGGVTKSGELWWQAVRQSAEQVALPEIHFEIVPAVFADDAPLWGAVALVAGMNYEL
ncbi:MAG: ROK family protein [Anaerolineae bacterium]|nr:ROK family protein [Anaerolineae bacterium]